MLYFSFDCFLLFLDYKIRKNLTSFFATILVRRVAGLIENSYSAPKGATGASFHTKGGTDAAPGNGFVVTLEGTAANYGGTNGGMAVATRESASTLQYAYKLTRYYASDLVTCDATGTSSEYVNGQALCADFCGIDEPVPACCSDGTSDPCNPPSANMGQTTTSN